MNNEKIKIGLTGGIGSGKSVVARILSSMGVPVYDSDTEAKRLTVEDSTIRKLLKELLGQSIFFNGIINKKQLATYLFESTENAQRINSIIHPCVKSDFKRWVMNQEQDFVAIESAILIEAGFAVDVDLVILVYAPKEVRIKRIIKRDNLARESVENRLARQLDDEEKKGFADFIIINNGIEPLIPQVYNLLERIKKLLVS